MSVFSSTLVKLRKQDKVTQSEAAKMIGISRSALSMYETGKREPSLEMLERIADYYNVDMNTLIGTSDSSHYLVNTIIPLSSERRVPVLGKIACGEPLYAQEDIEEYVFLPNRIHADFALRCRGDSMINARICDGDIVYIRRQAFVEDGEIAAVLIDSDATLKRVYRSDGQLVLRPENPSYPILSFEGEGLSQVRILGRAVAFSSIL